MKKKIKSDEIDLIEVIINISSNKLKIAAITVIFIILSIALHFIVKPQLNAKTEIFPITIFEDNLYEQYNLLIKRQVVKDKEILSKSLINVVNKNYLLNLFIEELGTKKIIIEAIKNFQMIDQKKFDSEDEYLEEVEKRASKVDLLRPINVDGSKIGETRLNWVIEFEVDDEDQWKEALIFIEIEINKSIKNYLKLNFDTTLDNLKLLDRYKLEDLNLKINNVKKDYHIETSNRLVFLKEQALIARKLNIENNTLEVENFNTPSGVISNLQSAKPYYMRGYAMIEKEIELIETRTNKDAFTENLLDLEKQKRTLIEDKFLDRTDKLFNNTPIVTDIDFKAANIIYQDTEFEASFSLIKAVLFFGIFGVIFGIFYVLTSIAIRQRK